MVILDRLAKGWAVDHLRQGVTGPEFGLVDLTLVHNKGAAFGMGQGAVSYTHLLAVEYEFDQHNPFHVYDVWEHTLHALEAAPPDMDATVRLALLLHDIGKPHCLVIDEEGRGRALGHDKEGEPIAREVCKRLKLSRAQCETVTHLSLIHI